MHRGVQTRRLYAAERSIKPFSPRFKDIKEIRDFVSKVVESEWVRKEILSKNYWSIINIIDVVDLGRKREHPWAQWLTIGIPTFYSEARLQIVILHEIAHIFMHHKRQDCSNDHHGPEFIQCYLSLVRHFMGKKIYDLMCHKLQEHKVCTKLESDLTFPHCCARIPVERRTKKCP